MLYNTYYKFYFYFFIWCSLYIKKHHVLHIFLWWLPHFNHHLCNSQVRMIHLQSKIWRQKSLVFSVSLAEKTLLKGTILLSSTSFDDKNPTSVGCILQCMEKTPSFYERFTFWDDCDMNVCLKIEIKRWLIHGISTLLIPKLQLTRFLMVFRQRKQKARAIDTVLFSHCCTDYNRPWMCQRIRGCMLWFIDHHVKICFPIMCFFSDLWSRNVDELL